MMKRDHLKLKRNTKELLDPDRKTSQFKLITFIII